MFFSLILVLMISMLLSMVDALRITGMQVESRAVTKSALASSFSEFQPILWNEYGVLGMDWGYGHTIEDEAEMEERITEFIWNHCDVSSEGKDNSVSLLQMEPLSCQVREYVLLTDGEGEPFIRQGIQYAKVHMAEEEVSHWMQEIGQMDGKEKDELDVDKNIEEAKQALQQPQEIPEDQLVQATEEIPIDENNNPFSVYKKLKENGWIGLILGDTQLSEKTMNLENAVSKRYLIQGSRDLEEESLKALDKALYQWYLVNNFGRYDKQRENGALSYELEYVIGGKSSDTENLESVLGKIIGLRELENVASIAMHPAMMQRAYNAAVSIAGGSANPVAVVLVQAAIVSVWALAESVLDVRTLCKGKKIPLLKTEEQWTISVQGMAQCLSTELMAKEDENGISYGAYLAGLMYLLDRKELGLRPLDLMEVSLTQQEEYVNARMDQMVCQVSVTALYCSKAFTSLSEQWHNYSVNEEISYM